MIKEAIMSFVWQDSRTWMNRLKLFRIICLSFNMARMIDEFHASMFILPKLDKHFFL